MSLIVVALLALGQAGGAPATAALPAGAQTLQQRFDAATQLAAQDKCEQAVPIFDAIAPQLAKSKIGGAALRLRRGKCLIALDRRAEGDAAMRAALPVLAAQGATFTQEVSDAHLLLARAALADYDYDRAAADARAALALSTGVARLRPLMLLASTLMFDRDGAALGYAQEARTIAFATPTLSKKDVSNVQTIYARVLLNEGRNKEAYAELKDSLARRGGLTLKVDYDDVAMRSDLAIAALRNDDLTGARKYLSYTGAGRIADAPFARAVAMEPPTCADVPGLTPQDVAIVAFSLTDDGRVSGAQTIFSTGKRDAAIAFARAASRWSWRPDQIKSIQPFFRQGTRLEMRCLKTAEAPGLTQPLADAANAWMVAQGVPVDEWNDLSDAAALPRQRAMVASATGSRRLGTLIALASNPVLPAEERKTFYEQAMAQADAVQLPTPVRTFVRLIKVNEDTGGAYRSALRQLLVDPVTSADPLSAATVRLLITRPAYQQREPADSAALLDAVVAEPGLPARHPLKIAAMLQQANVRAAKGDLAGAQQAFAATGLTAEQCSLLGISPALRSFDGSSGNFPREAARMGFEGWARSEFDISADGRAIAPRVVVSYPPFVFDDAATGTARDSRWTSSFRPEGALACAGQQQSAVFLLPR